MTYDEAHEELRKQIFELKTRLNELETRVWTVMDNFYNHTHEEPQGDDQDRDDP